jgi:hypothetical protein
MLGRNAHERRTSSLSKMDIRKNQILVQLTHMHIAAPEPGEPKSGPGTPVTRKERPRPHELVWLPQFGGCQSLLGHIEAAGLHPIGPRHALPMNIAFMGVIPNHAFPDQHMACIPK